MHKLTIAFALAATLLSVTQDASGLRAQEKPVMPLRVYQNHLTPLTNPAPLLADYPEFVQPVRELRRFEAPILVDDAAADLSVRAWRFSYNARGIIEMPNRLRAKETAVILVHPWGIDDGQGWATPEPAGVCDFCTIDKNHLAAKHTHDVINPFLKSLRGKVAQVMYSLPGPHDPIRKLAYRSIHGRPTEAERLEGQKQMSAKLKSFSYRGQPLIEQFEVSTDHSVIDYFRKFPGLDAGPKFNGAGFWELPIPVTTDIDVDPEDIVIYDAEGYEPLKQFLKSQGVRHVLLTGYATDMCFCRTTAGYENLSKDFNVFLVGDATLATFPANDTPRYATNAHISFASLNQLVTQISWVQLDPPPVTKTIAVDEAPQDFATELPKIAAKTPEESLKAMRLKTGFHAELVAAEPLIRSPMAMDFDEFGRAYVVELPEYNQYGSSKPHGKGAIKRLEDTDGDGRYDRATVFVDDLDYPTAVACWNGGILVGVAPDLLFCQDTDGDGKADVRRKLFTGFGQDKAGEGMLNSFRWRIDNRFHIPCGLDGGEIVRAGAPDGSKPTTAPDVKPINVRGQHLLLDPRTWTIAATSGGGQHGMSLDDWNLRAFVCGNSEPAHLVMYDGRYLARNPYVEAPAAAINIAPDGKFTKLMRVSGIEPWRVLRTRLRNQGVIPGSDEGGTPSGFFTGATGITVYRGDAWPAEYRGQLFVGEVANNLVYRARLEPNGVGLTAHRADPDAEFLASADNWFRPVQFANAPDGTLYVIDMYRQLIEGAAFLAPQILKHMDASAGADKGRIYRIAPDGFQFKSPPRIGDLPTAELVKFYEHPNAWHRDTASRLIYQRQDQTAVPALRELAAKSKSPLARVMAVYSLQGLSAIELELVQHMLTDEDPRVREHALRIAESLADQPRMLATVLPLAQDADLRVRYQAAFTLGSFPQDDALVALAALAERDGADSWMQLAILSSVGNRRAEFVTALLRDAEARQLPQIRSMARAVISQIGARNDPAELAAVVRLVDGLAATAEQRPFAEDVLRVLLAKLPVARDFGQTLKGDAGKIFADLLRNATASARDDKKAPADRAAAVRTLASAKLTDVKGLFAELLQSRQPQPVQAATLETLARFDDPAVPALVVTPWSTYTPQLRATAVETLLSRPAWIVAFLDAVEQQVITRSDLDPARVALLQKHGSTAIRERAQKLFASSALARRQEVVDAYQTALEIKGDIDRGRTHYRKHCATCHKLEGVGESIGADLNAIRDRGTAAVMLNILDPNREVKPQFLSYVIVLDSGRLLTGIITSETATSLTVRKTDNTTESVLRLNIDEMKSTGMSFMPEGLEKQLDPAAMADLLAYLNAVK